MGMGLGLRDGACMRGWGSRSGSWDCRESSRKLWRYRVGRGRAISVGLEAKGEWRGGGSMGWALLRVCISACKMLQATGG